MSVSPSSVQIDYARDASFDNFTIQTLQDRYLFGDEKSPQDGFARAAAAFADDEAHAQRLYDYVSKGWFMFATPLLSNGGTDRGLPISCYLSTAEDSRAGIFDHWTEIGWLSSEGGGVGGYWPLRSNGVKTSRGSSSTGVIPFIATVDRLILSVSQGGTRRGSYAAYMDIFHPEIKEFIGMRKPTGGDENRKGLNLHNAVNITDEFMIAVRDDLPFNLRDIKSGVVTETVPARELWKQLMETRKQTGEPYLFFVDTANKHLPETQKAKGLRVNQSNLCVAPYTEILTEEGYGPIEAFAGQDVKVWNGEDWSEVTVEQTNKPGSPVELVRVHMEDGSFIDCTPYHKFYSFDGHMIRAGELQAGTTLEALDHPVIRSDEDIDYARDLAYAAGYATFKGYEDKNRLTVFVGDERQDVIKRLLVNSVDAEYDTEVGGMYIHFEPGSIPAGDVPFGWTPEARHAWLGGAVDAVGEWVEEDGETFLVVATPDTEMVRDLRLCLLEAGLHPHIRIADAFGALLIHPYDVNRLAAEGHTLLQDFIVDEPYAPPSLAVVADVTPVLWKSDTYCFTEKERGRGVFNGVLTGNCTEITLATGRDNTGKKRTAVCCLSSVNAEKYDEWKHEPRFIEDLMRMLDNCIELFITQARPELAYAVYSAMQERSVGLGLLGFHAYLQQHMVAFESEEARRINLELFTYIRAGADAASLKLGAERGEAPDMEGTGERFAHKIAIAPNASSSILCGNTSPSIEPFRSNAYLHKTLSGSFPVKNRYLERALEKYGLDIDAVWKAIIGNEGSVQALGERKGATYVIEGVSVPAQEWEHLREVFKTFTELDMRSVIRLAVDRQPSIDQAQSVNLAFPPDADAEYISEVHYDAWEGGLKSLYYYRSAAAKRAENTNSKVERNLINVDEPVANALSANPTDDSTCISCEG